MTRIYVLSGIQGISTYSFYLHCTTKLPLRRKTAPWPYAIREGTNVSVQSTGARGNNKLPKEIVFLLINWRTLIGTGGSRYTFTLLHETISRRCMVVKIIDLNCVQSCASIAVSVGRKYYTFKSWVGRPWPRTHADGACFWINQLHRWS